MAEQIKFGGIQVLDNHWRKFLSKVLPPQYVDFNSPMHRAFEHKTYKKITYGIEILIVLFTIITLIVLHHCFWKTKSEQNLTIHWQHVLCWPLKYWLLWIGLIFAIYEIFKSWKHVNCSK